MGVSLGEQETTINYRRTENIVDVWTSDRTEMTRFDRLCEISPENYKCVETSWSLDHSEILSKKYTIKYKRLLSFRSKIITREGREFTDEERARLTERLREGKKKKEEERRNAGG